MKHLIMLLPVLLCGACGSQPEAEGSSLSDGATVFTFRCDDDWAQCYSAAAKACGKAGYEEVDRSTEGSVSSAGRLQQRVFTEGGRDNSVYDEAVRTEVTSRVITVRCKVR